MDSVKDLLGVLGRIEAAIEGADAIKMTMRSRMRDYGSVLEALQGSAPAAFKYELKRLQNLFTEIEDLHDKHTADPEDGRPAKIAKTVNRGTQHKSIGEALDAIDRDVVRQFTAISAKSSINAEPLPLPDMAVVPAGALVLPHSYVERAAVQQVADGLTNLEELHTPYTVFGMGGGGKSVLASAVVRKASVREHFRRGIFWIRVGKGAKNSLLALLQGLAREMVAAPTDIPHVVPHVLDSLEKVKQHLGAVASTGNSPRLVVLDDVWEREVVDALLPLGLKVLVTTRDRSVVGVPTGCLKLGDMTEEEALELLLKTSRTVGQPGDAVRTQMAKVVTLCGRLPLVLSIAGSMSVVKGKGLTAGAWKELIKLFQNVVTMMSESGEESKSLDVVLGVSFTDLAARKREEFLKMAVLAPGAIAPIEMLQNLWETEDVKGAEEDAEDLVLKCLLQDVGGGGYRVHDLLLKYLRTKIKPDGERVKRATVLQAQYLGRLDVVTSYGDPKHGTGRRGFYFLDALWRSVEQLSGDPELEVASYTTSLRELESCEATEEVANSYGWIGCLFEIQGKYAEAEPLYEQSQAIREKVLRPEHPDVAWSLNNRALLLGKQGKLSEAEPLYKRTQEIFEESLGRDHPNVATILNNRAELLKAQGKYDQAEPLYKRAIVIWEAALGSEHPQVATGLNNRAGLLQKQGKYAEAEPLYERSQAIREKVLGPEHPDVAQSLNNRAGLLQNQGKLSEAEPLYKRTQEIFEESLGRDHPNVATILNNRALLLTAQGKLWEAEPLYKRTQEIFEKSFGRDHPNVAAILNNRAGLLKAQGKYEQADPLYLRAIEIWEAALGPDHPELAKGLSNRAGLLKAQGKYSEADPLYVRSIAIGEKALGPEHPDLATRLNNRATLLEKQGRLDEASPLCVRATEIWEKALGPDHPQVATALNNRAALLEAQENYTEAIPLLERALEIRTGKLGGNHPDTVSTLNKLEAVRKKV